MTTSSSTNNPSSIKTLIKDFWLTNNPNPELAKLQKGRWYYLSAYILLEITLAIITFFATICFGVFMGAIEAGSMLLFTYYAPILAGLLLAAVITYVGIRFFAKKASDLWKTYVLIKESSELNPKLLKKMSYLYDKESTKPPLLISNLSSSISDLFEVSTTVITAFIQFIPCLIILLMLNPMLPWLSIVICASIMLVCYYIAQIMNESQAAYMYSESQYVSQLDELFQNSPQYGSNPKLLNHQRGIAKEHAEAGQKFRNEYRGKKLIFDFFAVSAEKIIAFGPYIIFGYFAITGNLPMAVFTLMVTTFIQACMHLMKINEVHTTVVKINASTEQIKGYQNLKHVEIKPQVQYKTIESTQGHTSERVATVKVNATILNQNSRPTYYRVVDENHVNPYNTLTHSFDDNEIIKLDIKSHYIFSNEAKPIYAQHVKKGDVVFLSKEYTTNFAINDFNLYSGQRIWIYGASGVGKSLFLGTITGLNTLGWGLVERPKDDECVFIHQQACLNENRTIRDQVLAELSQEEKKQYDDETLMQYFNQYLPSKVASTTPAKAKSNKKQMDASLLDQSVNTLSGGEKNKLIMIRLLLRNPDKIKLITLDEPFAACPADEPKLIKCILERFKKATILFISHAKKNEATGDKIQSFITHELNLTKLNEGDQDSPSVGYDLKESKGVNQQSPTRVEENHKYQERSVSTVGIFNNNVSTENHLTYNVVAVN